jgi:hypothetical protein
MSTSADSLLALKERIFHLENRTPTIQALEARIAKLEAALAEKTALNNGTIDDRAWTAHEAWFRALKVGDPIEVLRSNDVWQLAVVDHVPRHGSTEIHQASWMAGLGLQLSRRFTLYDCRKPQEVVPTPWKPGDLATYEYYGAGRDAVVIDVTADGIYCAVDEYASGENTLDPHYACFFVDAKHLRARSA